MKDELLKDKDFRHFRNMLSDDLKLKEIVDNAKSGAALHGQQRALRIPYVSAPRLTEAAWKQ